MQQPQYIPKIDIVFHVRGDKLAVDHGFSLYSAISRILPEFHEESQSALKLIRGRYCGDGILDISPWSELVLRIEIDKSKTYMNLSGKTLSVSGNRLYIGIPRTVAITPERNLHSSLVISRNGQDQERFEKYTSGQLKEMGIENKLQILKRKTCQIHGKQVVGYAVGIQNLDEEHSIVLQENGLGGRKKMGAGFFEKWTC